MKERRMVGWHALALGLLLTLPGLARANDAPAPTPAAPPVRDKIAVKATLTVVVDSFVVPMDPPILSVRWTGTGQSSLLGPITGVGHALVILGVDGTPLAIIEGREVWAAANGDADFISMSGLYLPSSKSGFTTSSGTWTMTGGRGRLLGASGHGVWTSEGEIATGKSTVTVEGFAMVPRYGTAQTSSSGR